MPHDVERNDDMVLALPFTPIGIGLDMVAMPLMFFPWLFGIIALYAVAVEVVKRLYIKRYGQWL